MNKWLKLLMSQFEVAATMPSLPWRTTLLNCEPQQSFSRKLLLLGILSQQQAVWLMGPVMSCSSSGMAVRQLSRVWPHPWTSRVTGSGFPSLQYSSVSCPGDSTTVRETRLTQLTVLVILSHPLAYTSCLLRTQGVLYFGAYVWLTNRLS